MSKKPYYCKSCGTVGPRKRVMPGSFLVELVLWLLFLLPGLVYSVWRHAATYQGCINCKSREMIPVDSPLARQALADSPHSEIR